MNPLHDLKEYQKDLASAIRLSNSHRRNKDDNLINQPYREICEKYGKCFIPGGLSWEFRHHHIAYCELRGRTRDQIEIPGEKNLPNNNYVNEIKAEWQVKINEALCADAS